MASKAYHRYLQRFTVQGLEEKFAPQRNLPSAFNQLHLAPTLPLGICCSETQRLPAKGGFVSRLSKLLPPALCLHRPNRIEDRHVRSSAVAEGLGSVGGAHLKPEGSSFQDSDQQRWVHFIGIGGSGLSALALVASRQVGAISRYCFSRASDHLRSTMGLPFNLKGSSCASKRVVKQQGCSLDLSLQFLPRFPYKHPRPNASDEHNTRKS